MTCKEIENRLPAYLEDLLSPEERRSIAEHLAACSHCSRALLDLGRVEQLVRGLEEVEPPPFFEQKIMSRIREESRGKRGVLGWLFHPPHIKVPAQALATILIAVLAFYIYQAGDPEMKRMAPLPAPLAEPEKGPAASGSLEAVAPRSAVTAIRRETTADSSEKDRQRSAGPLPGDGVKEERVADPRTPLGEERPAMEAADSMRAAVERGVSQAGPETPDQGPKKAERPAAAGASGMPSPERKPKDGAVDAGAATGEGQSMMRSSPSRAKASASLRPAGQDGVSMRVLWRISEYRMGGSALWGEVEARRMLFKTLDIAAGKITFDGQTCGHVVFKTETVNAKEYLDRTFHSTPQALGIGGETVELVKTDCLLPGFSEYMRLNDRRIVIHINGVFFFFTPAVDY